VLTSRAASPRGTLPGISNLHPVITDYDPAASVLPANLTASAPPPACNCATTSETAIKPLGTPPAHGQYIFVSLSREWLWAYSDGVAVFDTPVVTGRPGLETPTGVFSVQEKDYNITFYSPWPPGSPNYYYPTPIHYAMLFLAGGYFLHDAWWRSDFGPGTNVPHIGPTGQWETGSHGCVQMPVPAAKWLITWVNVGTTVAVGY